MSKKYRSTSSEKHAQTSVIFPTEDQAQLSRGFESLLEYAEVKDIAMVHSPRWPLLRELNRALRGDEQ